MKKIAAALLMFAGVMVAQPPPGVTVWFSGSPPGGLGAVCATPNFGYLNTSTGIPAVCPSATHVWTALAAGSITGCIPSGSAGQVLTDDGSGGCTSNSGVSISGGNLTVSTTLPPTAPAGSIGTATNLYGYFEGLTVFSTADDDIGPELQAAIDACQATVSASTGGRTIKIPAGAYRMKTAVTWKTCNLEGDAANTGVRIYWDGGTSDTAVTKCSDAPCAGTGSFGFLRGINFRNGTAHPLHWLDVTNVDVMLRVAEDHFSGSSSSAIVVHAWYNAHWDNLRFDDTGDYAIQLIVGSGQFLTSFVLDKFTYDHASAAGGKGFLQVDNSANSSAVGTVKLSNARIEVNTAWASPQAIVSVKSLNSGANTRTVATELDAISYQDVVGMSADVILYSDTSQSNMTQPLVLTNFNQNGLSAVIGGTWRSDVGTLPLRAYYPVAAYWWDGRPSILTETLGIKATPYSGIGTCNASAAGSMIPISDANTGTFGANITGGSGANFCMALCNGTNWTCH